MTIRAEIPAVEGVKDNQVAKILFAMKSAIESITGRAPNRKQLPALGASASVAGIINRVNEIIARLQGSDTFQAQEPFGSSGDLVNSITLVADAVPLTTAVTANVASFLLPPGKWDISTDVWVNPTGTIAAVESGWNTVSATMPTRGIGRSTQIGTSTTASIGLSTSPARLDISSPTYVYLVVSAFFTVTASAYGQVTARLVR